MVDLETVAVAVGSSLLTSLATGGAVFRVLMAAAKSEFVARSRLYDENDRPLYIPREEFNGMSRRRDEQVADLLHRHEQSAGQIVSHTDRLADIDQKVSVMEERNTLILEGIARDLRQTADSVEKATGRLDDLMIRLERLDARSETRARSQTQRPKRGNQ